MTRPFTSKQIRLSKNKNYLEWGDGTPFFYLADTWWFALTERMSFSDLKKLVKDRKKKGFNAVQLVVGIPPEVPPRGYAFLKNGTINKKYFEKADKKIFYLIENGIVPCIFGGWGYHIDTPGQKEVKVLWKEIVKRYSSYPVIFCLTGEVDLIPPPGYFAKDDKNFFWKIRKLLPKTFLYKIFVSYILQRRLKKWNEVAKYIKKINRNKTPLTVHVSHLKIASKLLKNPKWLDIDSIQSGHDHNSRFFMVDAMYSLYKNKPIINMEPWYEGMHGNFGETYQRFAFWACVLSGAKGHAYGAHGVWQMANGDNFMKHWGKSDWKIAIKYKGSTQLGLSKKFLEKYHWWKLSPCNSRILPHFEKSKQNFPLSAQIGKDFLFIYFPDVKARREYIVNGIDHKSNYFLSFINPENMTVTKKQKFSTKAAKISLAGYNNSSDLLIMISKKP